MGEPRARVRKPNAPLFSPSDLTTLLYAFGDHPPSLPHTVTTLDEILTDFIIETCHAAALCASYSRRQKIKVDDFKWVVRRDAALEGRVVETLWKDRTMREARKAVDVEGLQKESIGLADLMDVADVGGVKGEVGGKKGRKGGRRGKRKVGDVEGLEESPDAKRREV